MNILGIWICQGYTRFWIKYFVIDVWQYSEYALDSEYATVLNMLGSHKVVNKIFHYKYLTGFRICFEFWKYQCYTGFCRKQPVIHVWQVSEHSLGSQSVRAWIYKGCEYAKVTHGSAKTVFKRFSVFWMSWVLNVLRFWMYQESKYAIPKGSE